MDIAAVRVDVARTEVEAASVVGTARVRGGRPVVAARTLGVEVLSVTITSRRKKDAIAIFAYKQSSIDTVLGYP